MHAYPKITLGCVENFKSYTDSRIFRIVKSRDTLGGMGSIGTFNRRKTHHDCLADAVV